MLGFAFSVFAFSCNSKSNSTLSPTAQKNLDAMHGVNHAIETKDIAKLGDFIADDAVDHDSQTGDVKGLDSIKKALSAFAASVDNAKTDIIKELADDEYAMTWARYTGTFNSAGMGYKAGDKMDMKVLEVAKFKDGKAVEHWSFMEPADVAKMMGGMQEPMMPMPSDSTKK